MEEELSEALFGEQQDELASSKGALEVLDFEAMVNNVPSMYTDVCFEPSLRRVDELGFRNVGSVCGVFVMDAALFGGKHRILIDGGLLFAWSMSAAPLQLFWEEEIAPFGRFLTGIQSGPARRDKLTSFCAFWRLWSAYSPLALGWEGAEEAFETKMMDVLVMLRHPGRFFHFVEPVYLEPLPRRLTCRYCEVPAAAPAFRFGGGELFCWCCTSNAGGGERDTMSEKQIADLVVQCKFCGQKMCRGDYAIHLTVCNWTIECPLCNAESFPSFRGMMRHWLCCVDCRETARHLDEMLGLIALVGRDVIRLIVQFLPREDVKRLAQCNSILRAVVKEAFLQFRCSVCGFYHGRDSFVFHPGKFNDVMSYGAVLDASLKVPLQRAKALLWDNSNYMAAGLAVGIVGALVVFELPAVVGVYALFAGVRMARAVSAFRKGKPDVWSCCGGSIDSQPCALCNGKDVTLVVPIAETEPTA